MDTQIETPRLIRIHADDNVAIVVNDFGLPAGARLPSGLALRERVPQGHKVALVDIAEGEAVRRYNVVIGYAAQPLPAGSWVNEERLVMPSPPALDGLPIASDNAPLTRSRDTRSKAIAIPMELSARAICSQLRQRCNASPAWSSMRCG